MENILEVSQLTQRFGGLVALSDINIKIHPQEIVGIIGPNGAGKSTLFNVVTGIYTPTEGKIELDGTDISGWKPYKITEKGFSRTFQNIRLFKKMTVLDNVIMGMHCRRKAGLAQIIFSTKGKKEEEKLCRKRAEELLKIMGLEDLKFAMPDSLPYGAQRKLEIARAMATGPKMLMLDEPAAGMNENETAELLGIVKELKNMGYTILLIEHDMKFVMNICERIYVLDHGEMIADGTPGEIRKNPLVLKAYLGSEE
ncbi:MAG: ABC transporter ATP-binding protein [Candidatus Metalachnospira sp.]|nr:ABC transporter ATP-binding protein [Candidatus Metalachnospira sp.]